MVDSKGYTHEKLSETLILSQGRDGFWLYDKAQGMNLGMRCKTERDAFVDTISYYKKRLAAIEKAHSSLNSIVNSFVSNFLPDEERDD